MNIDIIEQQLLADIDAAYNVATATRVQNIQQAVTDIVNYYRQNDLSLAGLASLEAVKDFSLLQGSQKMPCLVKAGYCRHRRNQRIATPVPLVLDFKKANGLNIICSKSELLHAGNLLQNIALRYILSLPENLLNVSIFDPSGSGSAFSSLLALSKLKGNLHTSENDISNKLIEIANGFTTLQTDKLINKYDTIEDYNAANTEKIPYRLLLLAGYPDGFMFRRDSLQALKKIIETGVKYGVTVLITTDADILAKQRHVLGLEIDTTMGKLKMGPGQTNSVELFNEAAHITANYNLELDTALPANLNEIAAFLNKRKADYEKQQIDESKKTLSFDAYYQQAKAPAKFWKGNSAEWIDLPLGFAVNYTPGGDGHAGFYLGKPANSDGNYHGLIGGLTGSGKSVLINNLIINSSYLYSPEELQFFIIDMKGNEYPDLMDLPHIKVLFQDSLRIDVALNVLEYVQKQYDDRVQLFRKHRVNEFSQYRAIAKLPRIVCIIDEFQTFNQSGNSDIKNKSAAVIDLLVGKGRSYGIHIILASQSLANAKIEQASMTNINVRLVLRLDESASKQILSVGNNETITFPNLQLVYNNTLGYDKRDNKIIKLPFLKGDLIKPHVAYLNNKLTPATNYSAKKYLLPGNHEVYLDDNLHVSTAMVANHSSSSLIYLGSPYLIKPDDSYLELTAETENNILMVGQDLETAYRLMFLIITQFLAQNSRNEVYYLQYTPKAGKYYNRFTPLTGMNSNYTQYESSQAEQALEKVLHEIERRKSLSVIESHILLVLPQINTETSMNARSSTTAARIKSILETGPATGVFTLLYTESYNAVYEISAFTNVCKFKLALTGGASEKILKDKTEVDEIGFVGFSAPAPYTLINPELIRVYNSYKPGFSNKTQVQIKNIIIGLFEEK